MRTIRLMVVVAVAVAPRLVGATEAKHDWVFARGLDTPVEVTNASAVASSKPERDAFAVTLRNLSASKVEHVLVVARVFRSDGTPKGFFAGEAAATMAPGDTAEVTVMSGKGLVTADTTVVIAVGQVQYRNEEGIWHWALRQADVAKLDISGSAIMRGQIDRVGPQRR